MSSGHRPTGLGLLALCCVAPLAAQPGEHGAREPLSAAPSVQVFAILAPEWGYQTTIAYDRVVSRTEAKAELAVLAKGLGYESLDELRRWVPGEKERRPLEYRVSADGSEIGFRLSERAFYRSDGRFKLEPFIAAYRAYRRIDLDLMVGNVDQTPFAYRGLRDYDNPLVRIRYRGADVHHAFQIEVVDPAFERLDLPPYAPPEEPLQSDLVADRTSPPWREWLGVVLLAAGSATVAYVLVRRGGRRRARQRSRRTGRRR